MFKSLFRLALLLGIAALVYYSFWGTPDEQAQAKEVRQEGAKVIKSVSKLALNLLKTGKQNLDEGKYDDSLDNIASLIDDLKEKAKGLENSKAILDQIASLENKKVELEKDLAQSQVASYGDSGSSEANATQKAEENAALKAKLDDIIKEAEGIIEQMEE